MAIMDAHFYHGTIRLYTSIIGTLFDQIKIKRSTGKLIKVPLSYAGQQKQNTRLEQNEDPNAARYKMKLPRISYVMSGFEKDDARITNKMHILQEQNVDRVASNGVTSQLNRVPYTFNYEVIIKTKHIDDMLQIIEQIVPYFNPSLKVVVKDNPDLDSETSVDIALVGNNFQDDFEGAFEEGRIIETTLSFTLDGYLYAASTPTGIIKTVYINYYDLNNPDDILSTDIFTGADL
jgi:hypothetical protein